MATAAHLTKDEELNLGTLVQKSLRAQELQIKNPAKKSYKLDGENLSPQELSRVIVAGERAIGQLVASNTGLVWQRARDFKNKFPAAPELEDLAQEGFLGLVTAIKKYDPERGNKLSTVAYYWINQAIGRSTNKVGRMIRLPENRIGNLVAINRLKAEYAESDLSTSQVDSLIMEKLKLTPAKYLSIMNAGYSLVSFNRPSSGEDGDSREILDFLNTTSPALSSEDEAGSKMIIELLYEKLQTLSELEKDVVAAAFLMRDVAEKRTTMAEVRDRHELSPQKFKRVLSAALAKVRAELEELDISFSDFID